VVKVAVDGKGFAVDFFRLPDARPISARDSLRILKHVGLYAYRRDYLLELARLKPTSGEQNLHLEQLRALEHGCRIRVVETSYRSQGVDRPQDLERAEKMLAASKEASS
jgi:3-deoxy-manno-octulosonate cytidylyltransferase (CMP-KDO synthetase)